MISEFHGVATRGVYKQMFMLDHQPWPAISIQFHSEAYIRHSRFVCYYYIAVSLERANCVDGVIDMQIGCNLPIDSRGEFIYRVDDDCLLMFSFGQSGIYKIVFIAV